jgi:hypothetical protein
MRDLLVLCCIGILSAAAWMATAGAADPGHGGGHGRGGSEGSMRHGGVHSEIIILMMMPTQPETRSLLFFGEPEAGPAPPGLPTGGLVVGGPEHLSGGHAVIPAVHLLTHVAVRVDGGEALIPQPAAPGDAGSDQGGAATSQPNPAASPSSPRPPGGVGPGRPVSGWSGPGLPGPGRPVSPRG